MGIVDRVRGLRIIGGINVAGDVSAARIGVTRPTYEVWRFDVAARLVTVD
jgi:hypothetical protein